MSLCVLTQRLSDSQSHTASNTVSHNSRTLRRSHNDGGVSVTVPLCVFTQKLSDSQSHTASHTVSQNRRALCRSHNDRGLSDAVSLCAFTQRHSHRHSRRDTPCRSHNDREMSVSLCHCVSTQRLGDSDSHTAASHGRTVAYCVAVTMIGVVCECALHNDTVTVKVTHCADTVTPSVV